MSLASRVGGRMTDTIAASFLGGFPDLALTVRLDPLRMHGPTPSERARLGRTRTVLGAVAPQPQRDHGQAARPDAHAGEYRV